MEKISAACAMEWSINLEKGLRSKKPGQPIESIKGMGPRLQQWSLEPCITKAISDMYGLVPGEDRTFTNTILLRLADAFNCGDTYTKRCILKVFFLEFRHLRKKGKGYNGILSKRRVPNYVELLKRVDLDYDTGNADAKALALRLFGCWADLAKDSPQIRYTILLSLQSSHVSEVKASLFAAGCFCLLSDDFACVVLEILINIISSLHTSSRVILAAIHVFSTMWPSSSIANRAYKAGEKLLKGLLQEEFKAEMLSSLSMLAFKSTHLLTKHAYMLFSCLNEEYGSLVKLRALKCLYFLLCRRTSRYLVNKCGLDKLVHIIDDNDLPLSFQCEALLVLRKIFCSALPDLVRMDMSYLFRLVMIVEKATESSVAKKKCLVLHLLGDILCSLRARRGQPCFPCDGDDPAQSKDFPSGGDGPAQIVCRVMSLIINHIASLMTQVVGCGDKMIYMESTVPSRAHSEMKQECKSFLSLILHLARVYPSSGLVALDMVRYLIQTLIRVHEKIIKPDPGLCEGPHTEMDSEKSCVVFRQIHSDDQEQICDVSELILLICRFANACFNILCETDKINTDAYNRVKLLVQCLQQSGTYDSDTFEIFCLCTHSYIACHCRGLNNENTQNLKLSDHVAMEITHNVCWVAQEWRALEVTKKMLGRTNYWEAYRAGKYFCSEGLWFAATFTFRKLMGCIQSDLCRCWLRSLLQLSGGESEIILLLFPKVGTELINGLQEEINCGRKPFSCIGCNLSQSVDVGVNLHDCKLRLARVYSRIRSSEEILAAGAAPEGMYYFQRWFLSLRAKVLDVLVDMLGLLTSHELTEDNLNKVLEGNAEIHSTAASQKMHSLVFQFTCISSRLNKLAKEYDLLATSFLDIDSRSFRSISRLALDCSLLSFCTSFSLFFSNIPAYKNVISFSLGDLEKFLHAVILRDLVERLSDLDNNMTGEILRLMTVSVEVMDNLQSRTQINGATHIERASLWVCNFSISGVLQMQEEAKGNRDEEPCLLFMRGLQLLCNITRKWMAIPFQTPKYFFKIRPCVGAELFIFNTDSCNRREISTSVGFQLSLNLCVQLKNLPKKSDFRVSKMYCILAAKPSDRLPNGQLPCWGFHPRNTDQMVELTEMLLMYIRDGRKKIVGPARNGGDDLVTTFACFEPIRKGQGFAPCLLDVSEFPQGSYEIKWQSCCTDESGSLWSLLPLSTTRSVFTIKKP